MPETTLLTLLKQALLHAWRGCVDAGSAQVDEAGATIKQINLAITQMDEVTQQNAALVEEAAAAAQSMQDQAERLAAAVAQFKLASSAGVTPPAQARVARPASRLALAR